MGIGIAPLLALSQKLLERKINFDLYYGGRNKQDLINLPKEIKLSKVNYATEDGSRGVQGRILDFFNKKITNYNFVYACGPKSMLKALQLLLKTKGIPAEFAMENLMACGFGVCLGCVIKTNQGLQRVCQDGPVFKSEELIFE